MRWLIIGCWLIVVGLLLPSAAVAQEVTDDQVNQIAKGLYCPVCENTPLDTCPTQACIDWRDEIRTQLENGATEADVQQYFVSRFGDRVLARPQFSGFSLLVWVLPALAVVGGGAFFGRYLAQISRKEAQATVERPAQQYIDRIEAELAQRRQG